MKRLFFLFVLVFTTGVAAAQFGNPNLQIRFTTDEHDFGTIKEVDGVVEYTFTFTNVSEEPFVIVGVSSSCGCTVPEYEKAPVLPGKTGNVKVLFDPRNQSGVFNKKVYINSNGGKNMNELTITGTVIPRPRTIEDDFPIVLREGVRASSGRISMSMVPNNRTHIQVIDLYNGGKKDVKITARLSAANPYASIVASPQVLKPQERGQLIYTLDMSGVSNVWGRMDNNVSLVLNDAPYNHPFPVTAIVIDNFVDILQGGTMDRSPKSLMTTHFHHFGNIRPSGMLTRDFEIANEGEEPLVIHAIEPSSERITYRIDKTTLKKGEKALIKVSVDPSGVNGNLSEMLLLIQNDPVRPVREVRMVATCIQ